MKIDLQLLNEKRQTIYKFYKLAFLNNGMPTQRWREVKPIKLKAGSNNVNINLEWDKTNMFAYPTNFKKDIYQGKGKKFNAYHFVHIADLAVLYEYSKDSFFYDYCRKWISYIDKWSKLSYLDPHKYEFKHYLGNSYMDNIHKKLKNAKKDDN